MLLFIDEPRNIKIIRQESEAPGRVPLGKIKKAQLEISEEMMAKLNPGEAEEIEAVFKIMIDGDAARLRNVVAAFPTTMREVLNYYRESASEAEQRWILGSMLEGLRIVRRHEREIALAAAAS